eukprot:TRINITY_DN32091_c0_g1_i1.p1 TRINITY_DN32091_c0_g1~~TRINITY_DN32091_c0_g1_i1.p1  ORF type:complete len:390 (+),score=58.66 TRINITY_DN32091_c0_g1_i1:55-1224(+)
MLQGVRVVELATVLAAPSATAALADYGADVIKVESPSGDMWRNEAKRLNPNASHGPMFDNTNRGKKSVVMDLKKDEDVQLLHRLLETADVFVTNVTTQALVRLGLDYETIRERYPKLVYAHLTGWGRTGPGADRPGYDVGAWWAASGIMDFVRSSEDAPPPRYQSGLGDMTTASQLLAGIGIALFHKERTGKGQLVDVCLLRSAMYVQGCALTMASAVQANTGSKGFNPAKPSPLRADRTGVFNPAMNNYRTKDGQYLMLVGVEMMRHLPGILEALGIPHLIKEIKGFPANKAMFVAEMDKAFAQKTEAEWVDIFDKADVWYTRVRKLEDMLHDEQANACRSFVEVPGMKSKLIASPIVFGAGSDVPKERAPVLGANTEEILAPLRSKL